MSNRPAESSHDEADGAFLADLARALPGVITSWPRHQ